MAKQRRFPYWMSVFVVLAIGVASWSFYNLIYQGTTDLLLHFNIENFYIQNAIIFGTIMIILILLGFKLKSTFKNKVIG